MKTIALLVAFSFAPMAQAVDFDEDFDPEKVIEYRQDYMTAVKGHNNAIKAIVNGVVPYEGHLNMHLASLETLFNDIESLFPEGSDFGETNAKDAIWDNPEKFNKTAADARQALETFKGVVSKGDLAQTRSAFKKFGKESCGSCHKSFKKKED